MNDNKLIFSLVIGVSIIFGLFMLLTLEEQEPLTEILINEPVLEEVLNSSLPDISNEIEEVSATQLEGLEKESEVINGEFTDEIVEPLVELVAVVETLIEPRSLESILPSLNNSDVFVKEELAVLDGGTFLLAHLVSEELVRKFVVMVENISRGEFPERNLPLIYPEERMAVTELGSEFYLIDEQSYQRFNGLVESLTNISTENAVDFYRYLLPLFREAYAELGLRNNKFNDVLMLAIDNVLEARDTPQPQQLIRPNLNYLYANPELENYSDLEKLLLRLGPENTEYIKRRLEFFKRRIELDTSLGN
ncbi:MAG: DUF3014 domain-containing protein [Pseudohongiellaceae bacterium]